MREWNINETPDTEEIAREEIQHDSYDDLRRKIRERLKQLLRLDSFDSEPLYDLSCLFFTGVPTGDVFRRFSDNLTRNVYNTIDWDLPDQIRARLEATYYTLQGSTIHRSAGLILMHHRMHLMLQIVLGTHRCC